MLLKPKEGLKIRRPDTGRFLAAEGEEVQPSSFWARRIAEGDVIEISDKKPASAPEKKGKKSSSENGGAK